MGKCSACKIEGHTATTCEIKKIKDELNRKIDEIANWQGSSNSSYNSRSLLQQACERSAYHLELQKHNQARRRVLRDGKLLWTFQKSTWNSIGSLDDNNPTYERRKFLTFLGSNFVTKGDRNLTKQKLDNDLKLEECYLVTGAKPKVALVTKCPQHTAIQILQARSKNAKFRKNAVEWYAAHTKSVTERLIHLKNAGIIASWFYTPRGNNLVICDGARGEDGNKGIILKCPEIDVFIQAENFDCFKEFYKKGAYVSGTHGIVQFDAKEENDQ